jgi:hypothetical protein
MGEMLNWVKSSPAKTKITQPLWLHIHKAFNQSSGLRASDQEPWKKQNCLVSDPGDPESEAIFCSFWNTDDLTPDVGRILKITPGPKGGGIEIEDDYKDASKRTLKVSEAANVSVDGAIAQPPQQAATPAAAPPPPPAPPQLPTAGAITPVEVVGNGPIPTAPPTQLPTPARADQDGFDGPTSDDNLRALRNALYGSAQAYELAMNASVMVWERLVTRHGLAPSVEDLRATATNLLLNARDALSTGAYGSGAARLVDIPHQIEQKSAATLGQQLVAERAKVDAMLNDFASSTPPTQPTQPTQPAPTSDADPLPF